MAKILLADDSEVICQVLTDYLKPLGYQVVIAKNGVEAIEKAYQEIPNLIIMDVEMPLLKGYQASRLLKKTRGVQDIPIIMHTTLAENKNQFWGLESGIDSYITKDFDNLEQLYQEIKKLTENSSINTQLISEDAKSINKEVIFEKISNLLDKELFDSSILNELAKVGKKINSLSSTIKNIFSILKNVCDFHIVSIVLQYNKQIISFTQKEVPLSEKDEKDFLNICLNDYHQHLPKAKEDLVFIQIESNKKIEGQNKKISSYSYLPLHGKGKILGSIHLGNKMNNYFSDVIYNHLEVFTKGAGIILENSVLVKNISDMEKKIRNVFSKFVPAEIINDLVEKQSAASLLVGEKRNVVVLFCDIRYFTNICENNTAEDVVSFLNNYFEIMVNVISKFGGNIDKFIGDAILGVFGAPTSYEDNARRAIFAATEMINSLKKIDSSYLKMPHIGFKIGIGIHEGEVIVGNIGSKNKFNYTIIGDTVNLASRLESLTKYYKTPILLSESVKKNIQEKFKFRKVDVVKVKGKDEPTSIFSVEDVNSTCLSRDCLQQYQKAMSMYEMKNWNTALKYFKMVFDKNPKDEVSQIYIHRCEKYIKNPPPKNWDGAEEIDFK